VQCRAKKLPMITTRLPESMFQKLPVQPAPLPLPR
jgi:hypothetical protein